MKFHSIATAARATWSAAKRLAVRALRAIEPHYDWGKYGWDRLDGTAEGWGRHIQIEWLGLKMSLAVGRQPRKGEQRS